MQKPKRLLFGVLALALGLGVGLLVLEGVVRLRQWLLFGTTAPTVHELVTDPETRLRIPKPGLERPGLSINSLGFRGPEIAQPKPGGTIRLAFLGASTTYCAEVSSNEATWPHLVTERLRARYPELTFDYVNGGVPGYTLRQSRRNLARRIAPLDPDVIIIYHGTNDLSRDTRRLAIQRGLYEEPERKASEDDGRLSTLWALLEKNWEIFRARRDARASSDALQYDPQELSEGFEASLRVLVARSAEVAPIVVLATFSYRMRPEQSREELLEGASTSLYYMPYMSIDGLLAGFEEYNAVTRRVAAYASVPLIGGENDIPGDDRHFVDSVHFTDLGAARMADRVLTKLDWDELIDKLRSSHRHEPK